MCGPGVAKVACKYPAMGGGLTLDGCRPPPASLSLTPSPQQDREGKTR